MRAALRRALLDEREIDMAVDWCANAVAVVVSLNLTTPAPQASVSADFTTTRSGKGVVVETDGRWTFDKSDTAVKVTLNLPASESRIFVHSRRLSGVGYADDDVYYSHVQPVPPNGNDTFKDLSATHHSVSFCYRNSRSHGHADGGPHDRSRYVLYLGEVGDTDYRYWIDPIISNGGNPLYARSRRRHR